MMIVQPNPEHSSTPPSLDQVQALLCQGLAQNLAAKLTDIEHQEMWVREHLLSRTNPEALTTKGWQTVATVLSLQPVTCPEKVKQILGIFTENLPMPPHEASLDSMFYLFARHHRSFACFSFEQLANLSRLAMELYREQGTNAFLSLKNILQQCDTTFHATPALRISGAYFAAEELVGPSHLESFRRRIRIGLLTQERLRPAELALHTVQYSSLSEQQKRTIESRWETFEVFCAEHLMDFDPAELSMPYRVAKEVAALEKLNSLVADLRERGFTRFGRFGNIESVRLFGHCHTLLESYVLLEKLPQTGEQDVRRFFEFLTDARRSRIGVGVSAATLSKLVRFSESYRVPLRAIPSEVGKLQPETIERYRCRTPLSQPADSMRSAPREVRTTEELMELCRELERCRQYMVSLSPTELDLIVKLYDHMRSDQQDWDSWVGTEFVRRYMQRGDGTLQPQDARQLRLALALFRRLRDVGHEPRQAASIGVDYATTDKFRGRCNRAILRSFLQLDSEHFVCEVLIAQARDPRISDQVFLQAFTLAGELYKETWGSLASKIEAPDAHTSISLDILRKVIAETQISSFAQIWDAVNHLLSIQYEQTVREHLLSYIATSDPDVSRVSAGRALMNLYNTDSGPYPSADSHSRNQTNPEYLKMWKEVSEIYRGIFDLHYGFGHSTFECRTPPTAKDWMLLRFAFDSAFRVSRLVSTDPKVFPGPGCLISGLNVGRLLAADPKNPDDPYALFKKNWSWLAHVIEDLGETSFLMSRGMKMFIGPDKPTYQLDGCRYGLVVWNQHFDNPLLCAAALIPVQVIELALRGRFKRMSELGDRPEATSAGALGQIGLTFHELRRACEERNLSFLNLGWASNVGGLCNAYAPCSSPYFVWERNIQSGSRDGAGHVHKAYIRDGFYRSQIDAEMTQLLLPLRQAHDSVYRVAAACLGLSDLFKISLSLWHKGLTLTEQIEEASELEMELEMDTGEVSLSTEQYKMLEEAYRWNKLRRQNMVERDAFPVLCIAHTFHSLNRITSPVTLDTYDLTLRLPNGSIISLDQETSHVPDSLIGLWATHVMPLYRELVEYDLRFLHRDSVRWEKGADSA